MNKALKELFSTGLYLLIVLCATYLVITFVGQRTVVEGESMETTLSDGDNLIVDKLTYRFNDPERFDIIVFPAPDDPDKIYIKRIIGMPGETVRIEDGKIYINDVWLEENYGAETMEYYGVAQDGVVLGEDEYFVLGDNRNLSKDSRYDVVGNIHRDEIIGRAWVRIWPFNEIGFLKHQ